MLLYHICRHLKPLFLDIHQLLRSSSVKFKLDIGKAAERILSKIQVLPAEMKDMNLFAVYIWSPLDIEYMCRKMLGPCLLSDSQHVYDCLELFSSGFCFEMVYLRIADSHTDFIVF